MYGLKPGIPVRGPKGGIAPKVPNAGLNPGMRVRGPKGGIAPKVPNAGLKPGTAVRQPGQANAPPTGGNVPKAPVVSQITSTQRP